MMIDFKHKKQILRTIVGVFFMLLLLPNINLHAQSCGQSWGMAHYFRGPDVFRSFAHNGSIWVAVGDGGVLFTSNDGINWTRRTKNRTNQFDVIYAGGQFVVVGDRGYIATSSNGISWTERRFIKNTPALWGVAYGNGTYVATGDSGLTVTSPDGVTWTTQSNGISSRLTSVIYGNSLFVAVGSSGFYSSSNNGVSWTFNGGASDGMISVAYGNSVFAAGGKNGVVYTSSNGTSWTKRTSGEISYFWDMTFTGSEFVGVGNRGNKSTCMIVTSTNGVSWTWRNSKVTTELLGVGASGSLVIAGGLSAAITISACGTPAPTLFVASPNGEEAWNANATETLRWGSLGTVGNVKLEYSLNSGSSWNTIVASTANDGSHSWSLPNQPGSTCRIRVSEASDSDPIDSSNADFTIGGVVNNTITITSPNGGEKLTAGGTHNITWTGSTSFSKVDIEYYNGSSWNEVVTGTTDDGSYTWNVPNINISGARLWIKGYDGGTNPTDYSNSTFTIGEGTPLNTITITAPNGGETLAGSSQYNITWESSVEFSRVDIEYYNGSSWNEVVTGTADDGSYTWTVPNIDTSSARLWIKGYDGGTNPTDYTDATFSIINKLNGSITVTSPNGGETWSRGSTEPITWTSSGEVGNVKIDYSTDGGKNWSAIVSSTANDGSHSWNLPSDVTSDKCIVKVSDTTESLITDVSNTTFSIGGPPELILNKSRINFGYIINSGTPPAQTVLISNAGSGTLHWSAASDQSWIGLSPASGDGAGFLTVTVDPSGKGAGSYTGSISISDPNVSNSPLTVDVSLTVKNGSQDTAPFGDYAEPKDGLTGVSGSIAVTGWVLDDIGVESVKIYREVNGADVFIGDAVFVEGARPDVELAYPNYPNSSRAGWGYMMLTSFLPEGQLIVKAIAKDTTGYETVLGTKTIYLDHKNWIKPFGAIDAPDQGGDASGASYRNEGWVLTPPPNVVPKNGSTINVFIDNTFVGKANYNLYREDIAKFFPDYLNANGAKVYFDFDSTAYSNGVHSIEWAVTDSAGNADGIGSRYFSIVNGSNKVQAKAQSTRQQITPGQLRESGRAKLMARAPEMMPDEYDFEPGKIVTLKGYGQNTSPSDIYAGEDGVIRMELKESERVVIRLGGRNYRGYAIVNGQRRPLPTGSTLDRSGGLYYWRAAHGFGGQHQLMFINRDHNGNPVQKRIVITIVPAVPE